MSRSTCIPLYPATYAQQTGNNFVADTRNMLTATCCPGVNAALEYIDFDIWPDHHCCMRFDPLLKNFKTYSDRLNLMESSRVHKCQGQDLTAEAKAKDC